MRTKEPVRVVCDGPGCGRVGDGFRETRAMHGPQGQVQLSRIVAPQGWRVARVRPDIAMPPQQSIDPFVPAQELARMSGATVEASYCPKCQGRIEFTRVDDEPVTTHEVPSVNAAGEVLDEREQARDEERRQREAEQEAAERAAFEAKRAAAEEVARG